MDTEWRFAGLRFLDVRDLKGTAVLDTDGSKLGHVGAVLRPGGLFLNHGITHDEEGWNPTVAAEFINRSRPSMVRNSP